MNNELLLLGLLRRTHMHGYQLNEFINRDLATCTDIKRSTAYFLLGKMAERGWVSQTVEQQGNRPPRHVYSLQPAGESEYQRQLRQNLAAHQPAYFTGDIGLAFLDEIPAAEALVLLRQRRQAMQQALQAIQHAPLHPGGFGLVIEHQIYHLTSELAWLDQVIARMEQVTPGSAAEPATK